MILNLVILYLAYTCLKLYISFLQINFIKQESNKSAVILSQEEYENAAKIAIDNQKFENFSLIFSFFINVFWLFLGIRFLFQNIVVSGSIFEHICFVMSFLLINAFLNLPFSIYEDFIKNKKYGFSNMTVKIFILDTIKSLSLTLVFGSLLVWIIISCVEFLGSFWWFWAFLISFVVILFINIIYPSVIAPIFNKLKPLEDGELKNSIENLLLNLGFKSSGVFVIDASKRDNRLNAYFGGLGATKRVVLFDTLIKKLSFNEILAVLGHELGHFKHKDIVKMIVLSSFMLFAMFFIFGNIDAEIYNSIGMNGSGAVIVFLILFSPIFSFVFNPLIAFVSRKNEFNADKFGARIKNKQSMIDALIKLGSENKAFPKSHKIYSFLYYSHPSLLERVEKLKNDY